MHKLSFLSKGVRGIVFTLLTCSSLLAGTVYAKTKDTVNIAYGQWASTIASANVVRVALEEAGYNVKLLSLAPAAVWQGVASGDVDVSLGGWLPTTHADYYERLSDKIDNLGVNLDGTQLGFVVPAYSKIHSIDELNDYAQELDGKIYGIEPGSGLQQKSEEAVKAYGLKLRLLDGSDATMVAELAYAIDNNKEIVVTGWSPHWKFTRWDLRYLEDPKNVFGDVEQIHTLARKGLKEDMPNAHTILSNFNWTPEQMGEVMLMNEEPNAKPYENAKKWLADNPDVLARWLAGTK